MSSQATRNIQPILRPRPKTNGGFVERAAPSLRSLPERIRLRAFELFQKRQSSGTPGNAESDWLQAERELRAASDQAEAHATARGEVLLRGGE
jgi:hypothetical protein